MDIDGCANCLMHGWKQVRDKRELQQCEKCKVIKYCGKECQAEHWKKVHKKQCRYFADPVKAQKPDPVKAQKPDPVKAQKPDPVKAQKPDPVKAQKPDPVKAQKSDQVKTQKSDPVKAQKWGHNEETCAICVESAKVGKAKLKRPDNPNYQCIFKEVIPLSFGYHPHPFPITGDPESSFEKAVIVLWQLLKKFELTQPKASRKFRKELEMAFDGLKIMRLMMWRARKLSQNHARQGLEMFITSMDIIGKMEGLLTEMAGLLNVLGDQMQRKFLDDPLGLWEVIRVVNSMFKDIQFSEVLTILQNPLADIPDDLNTIVSKGVSNSAKFVDIANQVLDALVTQVVPFEEVLRIICGGSLEKTCSFCSKNITIDDINTTFYEDGCSVIFFYGTILETYVCKSDICKKKCEEMIPDLLKFRQALLTTMDERMCTRCDFCFKLPPRHRAHRCTKCFTVMYCGTNCQEQDWEIHKEFCKKDADKRKKKFGSSGRKEEASNCLELREKNNAEYLEEELNKGLNDLKKKFGSSGRKEEESNSLDQREKHNAEYLEELTKGLNDLDLEGLEAGVEYSNQVLSKFRNRNTPKKDEK